MKKKRTALHVQSHQPKKPIFCANCKKGRHSECGSINCVCQECEIITNQLFNPRRPWESDR